MQRSKIFHTFHQCPNRHWVRHGKLGSYDIGVDFFRTTSPGSMETSFRVGGFTASESLLSKIKTQRTRRIQSRNHERYSNTLVACDQVSRSCVG